MCSSGLRSKGSKVPPRTLKYPCRDSWGFLLSTAATHSTGDLLQGAAHCVELPILSGCSGAEGFAAGCSSFSGAPHSLAHHRFLEFMSLTSQPLCIFQPKADLAQLCPFRDALAMWQDDDRAPALHPPIPPGLTFSWLCCCSDKVLIFSGSTVTIMKVLRESSAFLRWCHRQICVLSTSFLPVLIYSAFRALHLF